MPKLRVALAAVAFAVVIISCDSEDTLPGGCSGSVSAATQTGNTINITGNFASGQPIMQLTKNGTNNDIVSGTYDNSTASFSVSGVAKGVYTVTWILSCFNEDGEVNMTSSVTSITIS